MIDSGCQLLCSNIKDILKAFNSSAKERSSGKQNLDELEQFAGQTRMGRYPWQCHSHSQRADLEWQSNTYDC